MRKLLSAFLLLAVTGLFIAIPAQIAMAQMGEGEVLEFVPEKANVTKAAKLRTSSRPPDPDTVWIGHIFDPTYRANLNYPAGGYGPYKVGRGPNRPSLSTAYPPSGGGVGGTGYNGIWDFDRFQSTENDGDGTITTPASTGVS